MTLDDIPASLLARRWGVPQCGVFRSLPSSLDAIHDVAAQGAPAATIIVVEEQTAGRGRDGRTWRSPVGGVWLGMLLRPPVPVLGALSIFAFRSAWNDFLWPLIVLTDDSRHTLPVALASLSGEHVQDTELMMAGSVVTVVPVFLAFIFFQRYYIQGIMAGSVKG